MSQRHRLLWIFWTSLEFNSQISVHFIFYNSFQKVVANPSKDFKWNGLNYSNVHLHCVGYLRLLLLNIPAIHFDACQHLTSQIVSGYVGVNIYLKNSPSVPIPRRRRYTKKVTHLSNCFIPNVLIPSSLVTWHAWQPTSLEARKLFNFQLEYLQVRPWSSWLIDAPRI
jgi:hypothetical protein